MADRDDDLIRLSVPADDVLRPVIEVSIGVLGRRWGLAQDEVATARQTSGAAFAELIGDADGRRVEVEMRASPGQLEVHVALASAEGLSEASEL